jgi:hypothetical protein
MFGGDVNAAVEPANRPSVKVETVEHSSVAQWGIAEHEFYNLRKLNKCDLFCIALDFS